MASGHLKSLVRKCFPSSTRQVRAEQTSPNRKTTPFWRLPPEIRNFIFEQTYRGDSVKKVKSSRLAAADKKASKCVVEHLLVSKQWYYEAISIFAHSTVFEFSSFADLAHVADRLPGYIAEHIRSVAWHSEQFRRLELDSESVGALSKRLPNLRKVCVHINSMLMIQKSTAYRKAITRDRLDEDDFAMCHGVDALRSFRGLQDFQWVEHKDVMSMRRYYPTDRLAIWVRNLAAFEQYVLSEASKPK